uniref:Uncharacterized protein n=1 Tax=Ascaris lumbricoides TaxID=6252 RepID=A0A0M3I226_ASCLU
MCLGQRFLLRNHLLCCSDLATLDADLIVYAYSNCKECERAIDSTSGH